MPTRLLKEPLKPSQRLGRRIPLSPRSVPLVLQARTIRAQLPLAMEQFQTCAVHARQLLLDSVRRRAPGALQDCFRRGERQRSVLRNLGRYGYVCCVGRPPGIFRRRALVLKGYMQKGDGGGGGRVDWLCHGVVCGI